MTPAIALHGLKGALLPGGEEPPAPRPDGMGFLQVMVADPALVTGDVRVGQAKPLTHPAIQPPLIEELPEPQGHPVDLLPEQDESVIPEAPATPHDPAPPLPEEAAQALTRGGNFTIEPVLGFEVERPDAQIQPGPADSGPVAEADQAISVGTGESGREAREPRVERGGGGLHVPPDPAAGAPSPGTQGGVSPLGRSGDASASPAPSLPVPALLASSDVPRSSPSPVPEGRPSPEGTRQLPHAVSPLGQPSLPPIGPETAIPDRIVPDSRAIAQTPANAPGPAEMRESTSFSIEQPPVKAARPSQGTAISMTSGTEAPNDMASTDQVAPPAKAEIIHPSRMIPPIDRDSPGQSLPAPSIAPPVQERLSRPPVSAGQPADDGPAKRSAVPPEPLPEPANRQDSAPRTPDLPLARAQRRAVPVVPATSPAFDQPGHLDAPHHPPQAPQGGPHDGGPTRPRSPFLVAQGQDSSAPPVPGADLLPRQNAVEPGADITPIRGPDPVAPAPAPATPPPALHPSQQIAARLTQMAELPTPDAPLELVLDPPELGQIRVAVSRGPEGMVLHLQADQADTLELLRRHGAALGEELTRHGLNGAAFSFSGRQEGRAAPQPQPGMDGATAPLPPAPETPQAPPGQRARSALDIRL